MVIFLVARNPKPGTFLIGAAAILVLLAGNIRLRRVRQIELRNLTGNTEEMLDQSITRVETTARHQRFSALVIAPAAVIGALVAWAVQGRQISMPALQYRILRCASCGWCWAWRCLPGASSTRCGR